MVIPLSLYVHISQCLQDHLLEETADDDSGTTANETDITHQKDTCFRDCVKLLSFFSTFKNGWKIYIKQTIALVGFSMASLYLTVLGFSGVTSSYFLTQGLGNDLIGVFQGIGAIIGVVGTILYPFLRKKFGTIRTGLFGISTQLCILLFCIAAIVVPSDIVSSGGGGYYSPDCRSFENDTEVDNSTDLPLINCTSAMFSPSSITPTGTLAPLDHASTYVAMPSPSECENTNRTNHLHLYLMVAGIVGCRVGLWIFDLAVQQLIQEKVVEEERGVVSGVMNAMISIMDMLHYVLVIAAPRPENFNILTGISFSMVALGWLLYCIYVRKSRGHFFHFKDCADFLKRKYTKRQMVPLKKEEMEDDT